jgi:Ca2+-binding RTX toxin-like protein
MCYSILLGTPATVGLIGTWDGGGLQYLLALLPLYLWSVTVIMTFIGIAADALTGATRTVRASISYTLGSNVENLTLTGSAAIDGTGNAQDNELSGNAGNNTLAGGAGNDAYAAYRGMGQDRIAENDATVGNTDTLSFGAGIANNQLWFSHTGNDLAISIIGTADKMTVQNWYLGNPYHVEQIKVSDSKVLLDTQVEALVQAMAGFMPPAMGQTTLTASQQTALAPVLAANWY